MIDLLTILIVDDEKSIRDGLKLLLPWQEHGFHIIGEANNGSEALEFIKKQQPNIIITDVIMPVLDGLELSKIIQNEYPSIHLLVLSSYDTFPYVSQSFKNGAVDYLLKPTLKEEDLLRILKEIAEKITKKDNFFSKEEILSQHLNRYLSGYPDQEINSLCNHLGKTNYYIIYTNMTWYQNKQYMTDLLKFSLLKKLTKQQLFYSIEENECGVILTTHLPDYLLHIELNDVLRKLKRSEPNLLFILSSQVSTLEEARKKVQTFKQKSKEQRFYFKQHLAITESDFVDLINVEEFDTKKYLRSLVNDDFHLSIARIEDYFNSIIEKMPTPQLLKQQASSVFYTLFSILIDTFEDKGEFEIIKHHFLFNIGQTYYLEDFSFLILETIQQIKKAIDEQQSQHKHENETIMNIIQFIDKNYRNNISLTTLADTFHFNYNYLSKLFSQHFNTSFTDYLNSVRLSEAKRLLLNSQLTLSDISSACGYADLSYFSKLFKKYYGSSPSKYRRENQL